MAAVGWPSMGTAHLTNGCWAVLGWLSAASNSTPSTSTHLHRMVAQTIHVEAGSNGSMSDAAASGAAPAAHESGSALRSIGQLMAHQMLTRVATFVLNIMVARHIGPVSYGISAVQLYLLNTVILFLSREAIRRSTLRFTAPSPLGGRAAAVYERTVMFNLSWMSIAASIPLCLLMRSLFLASAPSFESAAATGAAHVSKVAAAQLSAEYARCISLYALASWIELLAEPLYVLFQKQQRIRARVVIDGAAVLLRCVVTFVSLMSATSSGNTEGGGLLPFAHGQLAYAALIVVGYYSQCLRDMAHGDHTGGPSVVSKLSDLLPQRLPALPSDGATPGASRSFLSSFVDPSLLRLTGEVSVQSAEKLALQEGEKVVLVSLNSNLDSQGVYGLIQNLGSLVARMVFQPLEEAAFMEFSLLFATLTSQREKQDLAVRSASLSPSPSVQDASVYSSSTPTDTAVDHSSSYSSGVRMLGVLLHLVSLVGLILLCFGPAYSYVFLDLLYGARWSSTGAPSMLSLYCVYILFMAINGVTEAFVSAVISTKQLRHYNYCLVAFSLVYLAACALLLPYGSAGLILANCVNMSLRIAYSTWFIARFFNESTGASPATSSSSTSSTADSAASASASSGLVQQLWSLVRPDAMTSVAFIVSLIVTQLSFHACAIDGSHSLLRFAAHISVGVACLAAVAATVWKRERAFLAQLRSIAAKRKKAD